VKASPPLSMTTPSIFVQIIMDCFIGVHNWRRGRDLRKTKKHRNVSRLQNKEEESFLNIQMI
jgi:hypothetical protein